MKALALLILLTLPLTAQEEITNPEETVIPTTVARKALQWMQATDPSKRQAAYRSFQLFGEKSLPIYRKTLDAAFLFHEKRLARLLTDKRENPYVELSTLVDSLASERVRIDALIRIDYKKDPAKITMLKNELNSLGKTYDQLIKLSKTDSSDFDNDTLSIATALSEIRHELNILDEEEIDPDHNPATPEAGLAVLKESFDGETYLDTKDQLTKVKTEDTRLQSAHTANTNSGWANASQKEFTAHLNTRRAWVGLPPLLLEEYLSTASVDHSKDMATAGFFAHTSPIEGKKSPNDRAKRAGFKHAWTGENIFMGSGSPTAAYNAWYGSDGHRFIMFAKGPNLIGIGPHGKHWTMMTGRKRN